MSKLYHETEHQELFYRHANLHAPIDIHIPSALGTLGYYVCVRVPNEYTMKMTDVAVHLRVSGLRPDDVHAAFGDGVEDESVIAGADGISSWVLLCRVDASRGDGQLTLSQVPEGLDHADVLLCTWLRFIESGDADAWLACQNDPQWAPNGIPLGGIGTGKVEVSRDGCFRNFSGNNNQDMPFEEADGLPGAYLSLGVDAQTFALCSRARAGIPPCPNLDSELRFPQVKLRSSQIAAAIDCEVHLSGPIIPHDYKTSSLPGFVLRWQLSNRDDQAHSLRCQLSWPNLVGRGGAIGTPETSIGYGDGSYRYWTEPDQKTARAIHEDGYAALCLENAPNPITAAADGRHLVAVASGTAGVEILPESSAACAHIDLGPGDSVTIDMAVVWEMPHWIDLKDVDRGLQWQNHFANAEAILHYLFENMDAILGGGAALSALLDSSDLPDWLVDRLVNCCYPLVTNSVWYRDGRFSINEGPTEMLGCYGTIDQRLGAHPATQLLFPELNAQELRQFGDYQSESGGINHDFGSGHLERGPSEQGWPDLTCSFILQHAYHAWATGDQAFAEQAWPRAKKALLRHAQWAEEGNGVAQVGSGLGTSYDGYHYHGTTPYMATLWLAALDTMARWAREHDEDALVAQIATWREQAIERTTADLWNGRYYKAYGSANGPSNPHCHAGMLAGQYFARTLAGTDVLPSERLTSCADAWLALNGSNAFTIPPDEVAADGTAGTEYGWLPYVESFGLAAVASLAGGERILPVWERMIGHMQGHGSRPCDTRLMYRPGSGEPSWGAYYMTAPASWLVYQSLLDLVFEPGPGLLRLGPKLTGSFAVVHPTFWGTGQLAPDSAEISLTITRVFQEDLWIRTLESNANTRMTLNGVELAPSDSCNTYARFACPSPIPVRVGQVIRWQQPAE